MGHLIEQITAGVIYPMYLLREVIHAAVERRFEVIGEALHRVEWVDTGIFEKIPQCQSHHRVSEYLRAWV